MPETRLKKIAIRNWMSVRDSVVEFPDHGLVLVQGLNAASNGKLQSIGSGKTALGEALSVALVGVTGRFAQVGRYSTKKKGNTLVTVECIHKEKPLVVELGYKAPELNKNDGALRFTYNGEQIWRDRIGNTRDDLIKLLTVTPALAEWTVYLDGDKLKFDGLSQRKSVELLMDALAQPPWTEFLSKANLTVSGLKRDAQHTRDNHQKALEKLKDLEADLEMARSRLQEAEADYKKQATEHSLKLKTVNESLLSLNRQHKASADEMGTIKKEIDRRVKINADAEHAAEIYRNECRDAWAIVKEAHTDLLVEQRQAQTELNYHQTGLRKIQNAPKTCPTCGQPWKQDHAHANLNEAQKNAKAAEIKLKAINAATAKKLEELNAARDKVKQAEERLAEVRAEAPVEELSGRYEALENSVNRLNRQITEAEKAKASLARGPDNSAVVRAQTTVEERARQADLGKTVISESAAKMVEDDADLRIAEYWQEAFSPNGIPNMILKDAIGPLNETSQRLSALMTGGCLSVRYDTSRELATGREKAELNIFVDNPDGSDDAEGGSKGECGLTNLIIAETLAEVGGVGHRLGYRWYDEVAANQDEVVRRSLFSYLRETAQRHRILIFVVSHTPEAASFADYILVAEKTRKNGTIYRWD